MKSFKRKVMEQDLANHIVEGMSSDELAEYVYSDLLVLFEDYADEDLLEQCDLANFDPSDYLVEDVHGPVA